MPQNTYGGPEIDSPAHRHARTRGFPKGLAHPSPVSVSFTPNFCTMSANMKDDTSLGAHAWHAPVASDVSGPPLSYLCFTPNFCAKTTPM